MSKIGPSRGVKPAAKTELLPLDERRTPVEEGNILRALDEADIDTGNAPPPIPQQPSGKNPDDSVGRELIKKAMREAQERKARMLESPKQPGQQIIDHDTIPPQSRGR